MLKKKNLFRSQKDTYSLSTMNQENIRLKVIETITSRYIN